MIITYLMQAKTANSTREIGQALNLGLATVRKCLKLLQIAGLVSATRGAEGGYQLAKPATTISLSALIRAVEGQAATGLTDCSVEPGICQHESSCSLRHNWINLSNALMAFLDDISIADMVQRHARRHLTALEANDV